MSNSKFTPWHPRFRRVQHDLSQLISLKAYASQTNYSIGGVRKQILSGKVIAYKLQSKWWVLPPD